MSKFRDAGSRAGIKNVRNATYVTSLEDLESQRARPKQLNAHTCVLRLDELEEMSESPAEEPLGEAPAPIEVASRMVAFFGPKGGTGCTSVATNVAGLIARFGKNAVIADMDLQLGAVPVSLNLKPERSIAELVLEAINAGDGPIQSGIDRHPSGLHVVAQGERIEEVSEVSTDRLPRFFDALGQTFECVVVDGLRDFSDHAVAVMDLAHQIVLVCTQDVPSVRASARSLRLFRRLGYGPERLKIVVNRFHKKADVTLEAIHNALGQPVDAVIRNDFKLMLLGLNHGVLVSDIKPSAGLSKDLESLALLLGGFQQQKKSKGFLSRLFGRG